MPLRHDVLVVDRDAIRQNYVRSSRFVFDALASVPFDLLALPALGLAGAPGVGLPASLLRLFSAVRLFNFAAYMRDVRTRHT